MTLLFAALLVPTGCGDSGGGSASGSDAGTDSGGSTDAGTSGSASAASGGGSESGGATTGDGVQCSSQQYWTMGDFESPLMHPGGACLTCHNMAEPGEDIIGRLAIAGTVFPTLHEPDDCNGSSSEAGPITVEITTADNAVLSLPVNAAGNFLYDLEESPAITFPITAKVRRGDQENVMNTPQATGDCNSCHTEQGANGAPGRILAP
ncbi:MAG: hypothetical protein H6713_21610 [Myxococcales bacterium]|nr:hypothetical protein [Myxococcales bacterium]